MIKTPKLSDDELYALIAGPDYPGGGQIISSSADIARTLSEPRPVL